MVGFNLLLKENHVVVIVEIVVFGSVGEHYFASLFDFLLGGDVTVLNVVVESLRKLFSVNERFEIVVFQEKILLGRRKEHSKRIIISGPFWEAHTWLIILKDKFGNLRCEPRWQNSLLDCSQNIPFSNILINLDLVVVQIIVNMGNLEVVE